MIWLPFNRSHFEVYKQWFEDVALNKQLGPIDEEWLMHVLQEEDGQQYAVFQDEVMVGVVGVKHPTIDYDQLVLTDIAVHPRYKGQGIGSKMLCDLRQIYLDVPLSKWLAYVSASNPAANSFFAKNKWVSNSDEVDEDGMIKFVPF